MNFLTCVSFSHPRMPCIYVIPLRILYVRIIYTVSCLILLIKLAQDFSTTLKLHGHKPRVFTFELLDTDFDSVRHTIEAPISSCTNETDIMAITEKANQDQ